MSVTFNNPGMTLVAGETLATNRLVKFDGTYADGNATDDVIGVTTQPAANGANVPVRFRTAGTLRCTAAGAITAGALVYKANDGKVGTTDTNLLVGRALEAASGDGLEVEVLPLL